MRLYLASTWVGDTSAQLLAMTDPALRVAVVSNAVDFIQADARRRYAATVFDPVRHFAEAGRDAFDLDLRRYFDDREGLDYVLQDVGLIWAMGGNVFLLRRAMAQSGLDVRLRAALAEDRLAYGGWSAGAVVAGSSLRGIEEIDPPQAVVDGYTAAVIWDGLGLIDRMIVPHVASDHPEAAAAGRVVQALNAGGVAHHALCDGEVLIMNGGPLERRRAAA